MVNYFKGIAQHFGLIYVHSCCELDENIHTMVMSIALMSLKQGSCLKPLFFGNDYECVFQIDIFVIILP